MHDDGAHPIGHSGDLAIGPHKFLGILQPGVEIIGKLLRRCQILDFGTRLGTGSPRSASHALKYVGHTVQLGIAGEPVFLGHEA
jgi:hypothetical protein